MCCNLRCGSAQLEQQGGAEAVSKERLDPPQGGTRRRVSSCALVPSYGCTGAAGRTRTAPGRDGKFRRFRIIGPRGVDPGWARAQEQGLVLPRGMAAAHLQKTSSCQEGLVLPRVDLEWRAACTRPGRSLDWTVQPTCPPCSASTSSTSPAALPARASVAPRATAGHRDATARRHVPCAPRATPPLRATGAASRGSSGKRVRTRPVATRHGDRSPCSSTHDSDHTWLG